MFVVEIKEEHFIIVKIKGIGDLSPLSTSSVMKTSVTNLVIRETKEANTDQRSCVRYFLFSASMVSLANNSRHSGVRSMNSFFNVFIAPQMTR